MPKMSARTVVNVILIIVSLCLPVAVNSGCKQKPVIFNFGDSNSDTGGFVAGLGLTFGPPNGRSFSHQPQSGRLCDGRLIIDFLCESLGSSYMSPYLESLEPNFTHGANFAVSGSSTLPRLLPFSLDIQVLQFHRFRARSLHLLSTGYNNLLSEEEFRNALYTIDTGQNDLAASFFYLSYDQFIKKIPSFIAEIRDAIRSIYQHGVKNFWVHNTGPLGCLPLKLAMANRKITEFDPHGCIQHLNKAAKAFNHQLLLLCDQLRFEMKNVVIVYVDIYAIKYHVIDESAYYGFGNPSLACCGYGGPPFNYNPNITCGQAGFNVCEQGSKFISWDGVHYTEAANQVFASKILSSNYSTPPIKFDYFCNT